MTSSVEATKTSITLKGSAAIICEYLNYGINSILFQRGIYPPETFLSTQQYGLTILMSKDNKIEDFLRNVLTQIQEWLAKNEIEKISMAIISVANKEVLECWDFMVQSEPIDPKSTLDPKNPTSTKDLKRIQQEIRDVMRQISATVSYLPLIDCICSFDVFIHIRNNCEIPEAWNTTGDVQINNVQKVELRSFSTGLQKVDTVVSYKMSI